jgi:peptidyl-prolyl cis-trans isomerase B (cyclophilin B)
MLSRPLAALAALVALSASLAGCSAGAAHQATDTAPTRQATGPACTYEADGSPAKQVDPPPAHAAVSGTVKATIATSAGDISMTLHTDTTPCTVNSFVSLADQGYFDGTSCHRLTTQGIYVLQCGDPTGTGAGGPGYSFADELSGKETYGEATVAMANAGPDTNGSQFFLVYGDSPLPPSYTVFGTMDAAGLKVVKAIADRGTADGGPDGAPKEKVTISSVKAG